MVQQAYSVMNAEVWWKWVFLLIIVRRGKNALLIDIEVEVELNESGFPADLAGADDIITNLQRTWNKEHRMQPLVFDYYNSLYMI